MKKQNYLVLAIIAIILHACTSGISKKERNFNELYEGEYTSRIAFPIGGLGAGMFCVEGNGAITNMSVRHRPDVFNEPAMFAALYLKGIENGTRVLEGQVQEWKKFGMPNSSLGGGGKTWGLPRFEESIFLAHFPFAEINLKDSELPVKIKITAWNPFIPTDADNSGLPAGGLEYEITNIGKQDLDAIFSYNTQNFMQMQGKGDSYIRSIKNGFILSQTGTEDEPYHEGEFAIYTDNPETVVNHCWFRGAWFDPLTMTWNDITKGIMQSRPEKEPEAPGASLFVPIQLKAGETKTVKLYMAWYVPYSNQRYGSEVRNDSDIPYGPECADSLSCYSYDNTGVGTYRPWYSSKFENVDAVADYWLKNYADLKTKTGLFTEAFYNSTLPSEVTEAIAANLTILKSPTVFRQYDGRMWNWEGCEDMRGSCHGSCTHVWNYAQAVSHLFPALERTLRETEFFVSQDQNGHQAFRSNLPIRPTAHDFHSAADGQLGEIMKVHREWRILGDDNWLKMMYPAVKRSMDYCIRTWDPREVGAIEEPHHNTYDIEFWGADGMITGFYAGALQAAIIMGNALNEDVSHYESLLEKSVKYMETKLYDGEYFIQNIQWKGLKAEDQFRDPRYKYAPDALTLVEEEGPKYQYGTGCLSDGALGSWISLVCGMPEVINKDMIKSHLLSVHKYNLKQNLRTHANPQRPTFAFGNEGGLLLCSWPKGGKLQLPFVYSDEVWTGIEYEVASHLMFEGEVEKGLDIVRTCRERYDGRIRNPFNEYECGAWYARAMASYGLLEGLTGVRYDAVDKILYIDSRVGNDFTSFLSTNTGFGNVGLKNGKPFADIKYGNMDIEKCVVSGRETPLNK